MKVVWHHDHLPGVDLWKLEGDGLPRLLQCVTSGAVDGFAIDDLGEDFEPVLHAKRDEVGGVAAIIVAFKANAASMVDARVVGGAHVPESKGRASSGRIPRITPLPVMRPQIRPPSATSYPRADLRLQRVAANCWGICPCARVAANRFGICPYARVKCACNPA